MARVDSHREEIVALMAEYGATNPRLFGSVARGTETAESDIDIAVDLAPGTGLFALGALRSRVESLLGARVDIVPAGDLKADVRVNFAVDSVSL